MLSQRLEFDAALDAGFFAAVPERPAVFLLRAGDPAAEPYVSKTANLRRRMVRLLGSGETGRKLNLRSIVSSLEYSETGSDFESGFLLYRVLRSVFPESYGKRLRLRFPPLIKLHLENEYPRASVTTRLGKLSGEAVYYGPFASRAAAEKFANDSLDFFKMRRCVEDLHPDPSFPGCVYSEMSMCLAPCFKGCTDEQYRSEVERVRSFLDSGGSSLVREISTQRDEASANLEFENAAGLHARLEKLKPVLGQLPEIVHRIDELNGLIVQPSAAEGCVAFFRVGAGVIAGPLHFAIQPSEHAKSQSMEARVEQALASLPSESEHPATETMEHLAILRRWYFRGSRVGEIFFADERGLPMRRIVRGISRVLHREKGEEASS